MNTHVVFRGFTSTRPFGVELEVNDKVSKPEIKKVIAAEDTRHPILIEGGHGWAKSIDGDVWHVKRDGTCGHEVASYKMSGHEDIRLVGNVADAMRRRGCQVDGNCGLHVHADLSDCEPKHMGRLLAYWLKIERIILQACPSHRRKNKHCRSMREKFEIDGQTFKNPEDLYYALEPMNLNDHNNEDKRITLNMVPYVIHRHRPGFKKCTAEIRMPEGTLVRSHVVNWVRLYLNFVDLNRLREWPGDLSSVGLSEVLRILGLRGGDGVFLLLGKELHETKRWFLERVARYTDDPSLFDEANSLLNEMLHPVETHPRHGREFSLLQPACAI